MNLISNDKTIKNGIYDEKILKRINDMCLLELSTLDGRIVSAKKSLGFKRLVPVYINECVILMPLYCLKSLYQMWINYKNLKAFYNTNNGTKIIFVDGTSVESEISYQFFLKQVKKTILIEKFIKKS